MKALRLLSSLFSGHIKIHTGQWAEDVLIRKLLHNQKSGIYVDVGSYHPFHHSNTAGLWLQGWHGINIDANKNTIQLFKKTRPDDINIHSAILPKSEIRGRDTISILLPAEKDLPNGISAKGTCDTNLGSARGFTEEVEVPVKDIESILSANHIQQIDYLNIDIEGCDIGVLHDFDLEKHRPSIISIEDYSTNISELLNSSTSTYLENNGYTLVSRAGPTSIFTRQA